MEENPTSAMSMNFFTRSENFCNIINSLYHNFSKLDYITKADVGK